MRNPVPDWGRIAAFLLFCAAICAPGASGESYALLIGINDYPRVRPLKGSVNDILAVRRVVLEDLKFPESNVQTLLNEQATKKNILAALAGMADRSKAGDTLLWYYSGHGWMVNDEDGDEALFDPNDHYDEALVPYDAVPWPRDRAFEPNSTLLIDDEIGRALARLYGRRLIVIFDSCYSGTATRAIPGQESGGRSLYEGLAVPNQPKYKSLSSHRETLDVSGQLIFISAASATQTASDLGEFDGKRHGALTASLLRTMRKIGPGWERTTGWEGLLRQARQDMLSQGFATQTPTLASQGALGKMPIVQFFQPMPASEIAELQSPGAFEVFLESNQYQFEEGERLELAVESARDGYLYIFDINAEQVVTQLFPNRFSAENRIEAGRLRRIPARQDKYQFRAGKPFGSSTIVALVTRDPWEELAQLRLPTSLQPISDFQKAALRDGMRALNRPSAGTPEWSSQKIVLEMLSKRPVEASAEVSIARSRPPDSQSAPPAAPAASVPAKLTQDSDDDANVTWEEQQDLEQKRPALFQKLQRLAERYSPVFWQDVSGGFDHQFRPWKDFFVRFDFDRTELGPNWPAPPAFQDEAKRMRNHALDAWLTPTARRRIVPNAETPGVFRVTDDKTGETVQLDLRPCVYWAVLTTSTHYFFHYMAFKAEDWKPIFGHPGDLEGTTIVVDRKSGKMVAALTLAHDDVQITRGLDDEPEGNIEVLVDPSLESRGLWKEGSGRPVNGALAMEAGRDGEPAAKEHQDIYSESRGHGQYGPQKIKPSRYIIYANFLDESTYTAPSFDRSLYPVTNKFSEAPSKHKYKLVFVGSGRKQASRDISEKTLWSEYQDLGRFPGGVNPPWCWRDNLFFRTGWWKDPRMILKIGDEHYRINPYLR